MGNSVDINGLTLKQILDMYSTEKLRRTLAGGTFSARMSDSPFAVVSQAPLPGLEPVSDLDAEALFSMVDDLLDAIE